MVPRHRGVSVRSGRRADTWADARAALEAPLTGYRVDVLRAGFTSSDSQSVAAACTITVIQGQKTILVDVGAPWERDLLIDLLNAYGLSAHQVDVVVCTHGHSDHVGNLNLFPDALLIVGYDICHRRAYLPHQLWREDFAIDGDVHVTATPGHSGEDVSVFVSTGDGRYAVVGDLFECADDLANEILWREHSRFPAAQEQHRTRVLHCADIIIPGHGPSFPGRAMDAEGMRAARG